MRQVFRAVASIWLLVAIASAGSATAQPSPQTYVVAVEPQVEDVAGFAAGLAHRHDGSVGFVYLHAFRGFSMRMPAAAAEAIERNPFVAYVEADQEYSVAAQSLPTGIQRVFASSNAAIGIDGSDDRRVDVDVAVIDSGVDLDHPDLNVVGSTNCVTFFASCGSGGDDGNGHGTHVAGTVGALDNEIGVVGMAPGARLWAVRVLGNNGTGTTSQIIAGMDWVTARAATIEVANMSITGGASASIDSAANRMADAGIAVAVAAGNNDADASAYSPARAARVLTVSAIADYDGLAGALSQPPSSFCLDQDDTLADFSNWGSTIEVAAPGCRILSTYLAGGYAWINGTSMASPHVAGALALLASRGFERTYAGVSGLYATVIGSGNSDWVDESGDGAKEPLLDVSGPAFAPAQAPVLPPPTVALSGSRVSNGSTWTASVTISVTSGGAPVVANVAGVWSNGASGSASCSTTPAPCTVSKSGIRNRTTSVTFTVATVGGSAAFVGTKSIVVPRP